MTRGAATFRLAAGKHGAEAPGLLDEADKFPNRWAYTNDRHLAVVHHMPSGDYEVADTKESEHKIMALAGRRCPAGCVVRS